jgi:hypothetical protein
MLHGGNPSLQSQAIIRMTSARFFVKEAVKTHTPLCFYRNRLNLSINIGAFKILGGVFLMHFGAKKTVADQITSYVSAGVDAATMTKTNAAATATNRTMLIVQENAPKKRDEFLHPFFNS